jgi:hypothetical protein
MPFALQEYDHAFANFIGEAIRELGRARDPILKDIELEESAGALGSMIQDQEGQDVELEPGSATTDFLMDVNAVRDGDIANLVIQIDAGAEQYRESLLKMLFGTLNTVTDATGNVVSGEGKSTFDAVYEALDRREWSLTDDDELAMPQIYMHPDAFAKVPPPTQEQLEKLEELQQRKLNELLARRRRRRLS